MKRVVSLQYNVMFKKAFRDPEIFTVFVRDFLNIDLESAISYQYSVTSHQSEH